MLLHDVVCMWWRVPFPRADNVFTGRFPKNAASEKNVLLYIQVSLYFEAMLYLCTMSIIIKLINSYSGRRYQNG